MDDELYDTVVMGAVQLQATFSVKAPGRHRPSKGRERRAHLSKGCTRGTVGLRCVLPSLRVMRFTTIAVLPRDLFHSTLSATCTTRCDPYTTVLVQL
jgi:hypothetical protein